MVPEAAIAGTAARVMDLQHPDRKMSKSADSPLGTLGLLDSDEDITRKVRKAVTDTDGEMRFDRDEKPGLANLLEILAAATGRTPEGVAAEYSRYGDLKKDVAAALSELLRPIRERRAALEADRGYVDDVLARGAERAHEVATATYARAADAIGLLDSDEEITRKVRKAVTDTDGEMRYDRAAKPGLSNLLEMLAAATDRTPVEVARGYTTYGDLKNDVAGALCDLLRPIRERRRSLERDLPYVDAVLERGAARAREVAAATYARAADAMGLLPEPAG